MEPIVSGTKINLNVFWFFFEEKYFARAVETNSPDNSLLAIEGWQIYVDIKISCFDFPGITKSA